MKFKIMQIYNTYIAHFYVILSICEFINVFRLKNLQVNASINPTKMSNVYICFTSYLFTS